MVELCSAAAVVGAGAAAAAAELGWSAAQGGKVAKSYQAALV